MGWHAVKAALEQRDASWLQEALKGECDPARTLELSLREMGHGPVIASRSQAGALGLYHCWHWCVSCGCAFSHSQSSCDCHRECTAIITIPVYERANVAPRGARLLIV